MSEQDLYKEFTSDENGENQLPPEEGQKVIDRLGVPVILETDAKSKCDKYVHLGMELAGTHDLGAFGKLYDLIRYPKQTKANGTV